MLTTKKTLKKSVAYTAISSLLAAQILSFVVTPVDAAVSAISLSDGGNNITASSSLVSTPLDADVTVNFTTATALDSNNQTITITLNGLVIPAGEALTVADLTFSGGALEDSPGTDDNGIHEVVITNGAATNADPVIKITLDNAAGPVAPSLAAGAYTLVIDNTSTNAQLETSATAANSAIHVVTSLEAGSGFFYIGDENDVQVQAVVNPVLTFVITDPTDGVTSLGNVNGGTVGPNLCDLGELSTTAIAECSYRLTIGSNASNGYYVNVETDGDFDIDGTSNILANIANGGQFAAGTEAYGITLDVGATSSAAAVTACDISGAPSGDCNNLNTNGDYSAGNYAADPVATTGNHVEFGTGTNKVMYDADGPNDPITAGDPLVDTALIVHRAAVDTSTAAGTYTQLVTYTVTPSF
jgi:hypothetical protein